MTKIYKPGQIITCKTKKGLMRYRITKREPYTCRCFECDVPIGNVHICKKYCSRLYNDWNKNPNGYTLKRTF